MTDIVIMIAGRYNEYLESGSTTWQNTIDMTALPAWLITAGKEGAGVHFHANDSVAGSHHPGDQHDTGVHTGGAVVVEQACPRSAGSFIASGQGEIAGGARASSYKITPVDVEQP